MGSGDRNLPLPHPAVFSSGFVRHVWCLAGLLPPDRLRRPAIKVRWLRLLSEDRHQPERRDQLAVVSRAVPRYHPVFFFFGRGGVPFPRSPSCLWGQTNRLKLLKLKLSPAQVDQRKQKKTKNSIYQNNECCRVSTTSTCLAINNIFCVEHENRIMNVAQLPL